MVARRSFRATHFFNSKITKKYTVTKIVFELKALLLFKPCYKRMETNALLLYIVEKIKSGISQEEIQKQLQAVGWSEQEIEVAYKEALIECGVPVPSKGTQVTFTKKSSTVEVVLNFFSFILLGIVVSAFGVLIFEIIDKYFPDPLVSQYSYSSGRVSASSIHYSIAALIIGFPLYYASMKLWFKKFREEEGKKESRLTKWVTYLVLLAAAVTVVGDLIAIVFHFLQGELTVRFFLQAITILIISGGIFSFYFLERKKIQYHRNISRRTFQLFGWGVIGIIVLSIIVGFIVGGSPSEQRQRGFDNQRSEDLRDIANCVERYAKEFRRLPSTLDDLRRSSNYAYCADQVDPETRAEYEYRIITPARISGIVQEGEFELCATFLLASEDAMTVKRSGYYNQNGKWYEHEAGKSCDTEVVVINDPNWK